ISVVGIDLPGHQNFICRNPSRDGNLSFMCIFMVISKSGIDIFPARTWGNSVDTTAGLRKPLGYFFPFAGTHVITILRIMKDVVIKVSVVALLLESLLEDHMRRSRITSESEIGKAVRARSVIKLFRPENITQIGMPRLVQISSVHHVMQRDQFLFADRIIHRRISPARIGSGRITCRRIIFRRIGLWFETRYFHGLSPLLLWKTVFGFPDRGE